MPIHMVGNLTHDVLEKTIIIYVEKTILKKITEHYKLYTTKFIVGLHTNDTTGHLYTTR